jgi:bile acid-coenzyme A ligase
LPQRISYGDRLSQLAAQDPYGLALVFADQPRTESEFSWAELDARANQVARLLAGRGVVAGSWVSVGLPNCPEHVFTTFGAWKLGATVLPMRWDLPDWERDRLLALAQPAAVVQETSLSPRSVSLDEIRDSAALDSAALDSAALEAAPLEAGAADPAFAIASSGSTGRPKLIVVNQPAEVDLDAAVNPMVAATDRVIQLVTSPLYHTNGFSYHQRLLMGARVVLMGRFEAAYAVDLVERWRVNQVILVPTMLRRIADLPRIETRDLSSLENVFYGGAPLATSTARRWLDLVGPTHFFFQYGGTEGIGATMARGDEWLDHEGTVGRPLNCEVKILDDDGAELSAGDVGDIFLRRTDGPPQFRYVGSEMPSQTDDGFSTFGDLGHLDEDGYLYISDRRTDMIVTGGANVFPAEVEMALCEHPRIVDAVVVGLPDPEWGRRLHALVEPRPGRVVSVDELVTHCKGMLASYKVPKSFAVVERIPRTGAGKINRTELATSAAEMVARETRGA